MFIYLFVYLVAGTHYVACAPVCRFQQRPERVIGSHGVGVTSSCEPPDVNTGIQT